MMTKLFYFILLTITSLIINISHPLSFGMIILTFSLTITLTTATMLTSLWFSYILFLVYLGGLLILFIYVASLAPNEKLNKYKMLPSIPLLIFLILISYENKFSPPSNLSYTPIAKFYSTSSFSLTLLMASYLLITLFIIVFMTNLEKGPLRSLN